MRELLKANLRKRIHLLIEFKALTKQAEMDISYLPGEFPDPDLGYELLSQIKEEEKLGISFYSEGIITLTH